MSETLNAFNHREWQARGLQDYGDFADCTSECNQIELADCTQGEWFYVPDEPLPKSETYPEERRVIYNGTWGNYNSPGASSYTHATIYFMDDPDDVAEYEKDKKSWEEQPEWAQQDMPCLDCGEEFDKDEMEYDDRKEGYVCAGCQEKRNNPEEEDEEDGGSDESGPD